MSGGSSGGSVVQQTAPFASLLAGQYGSNAAQAASSAAQNQISNAISSVNQNYVAAVTGLRPASQMGVQADDQLGQFLGLDPFMPIQPTEPNRPHVDPGSIDPASISSYIMGNTMLGAYPGSDGGRDTYVGAGSTGNVGFLTPGEAYGSGQLRPGEGPTTFWLSDGPTRNSAAEYLAHQQEQAQMPLYNMAMNQYKIDSANYDQDSKWANQYATPLTGQQIQDTITNQPGYQAQLGQGVQAIQNAASSQGYLGSGRILKELMNFGQNTESQYYNNYLGNLFKVATQGTQAAETAAQLANSQGDSISKLYSQLGDAQANSILSGANSMSQGLINANQLYSIMGQSQSSPLGGIGSILGGIGSIAGAFHP